MLARLFYSYANGAITMPKGDGLAERNRARAFDLTGIRCNFLIVLAPTDEFSYKHRLWRCLCDCGAETLQPAWQLRHGKVKSCGCKTRLLISQSRTTHGETASRTHCSWKSMLERCNSPSHKSFDDYGGRGIIVCKEWAQYENFRRDMGERPPGMTLGRMDNNGNYEKNNCRWETHKQQARNRRNSRLLALDGVSQTLTEWAEAAGISGDTLWKRLEAGWPPSDAINTPVRVQKNNAIKHRVWRT